MLFRQNIEPSCSYCRLGRSIGNGEIACVRRGITSCSSSCRRFIYDPLKRVPERPQFSDKKKAPEQLTEEDFAI